MPDYLSWSVVQGLGRPNVVLFTAQVLGRWSFAPLAAQELGRAGRSIAQVLGRLPPRAACPGTGSIEGAKGTNLKHLPVHIPASSFIACAMRASRLNGALVRKDVRFPAPFG